MCGKAPRGFASAAAPRERVGWEPVGWELVSWELVGRVVPVPALSTHCCDDQELELYPEW